MKKNISAWDRKMTALMFRWRWVATFGAVLQIWSVVERYQAHDATGIYWLPSAWVLPWLTFGCVSTCVFMAGVWIMYLDKPRPSEQRHRDSTGR